MSQALSSSKYLVRAFLGAVFQGQLDQFIDQLAEGNAAGFPPSSSRESRLIAAKCFPDILRNGYEQRPVCRDKLLFLENVGCSRKIQEGTFFASRARGTLRGQSAGEQQSLAARPSSTLTWAWPRVFYILAEQGEVICECASGTKELLLRLRLAKFI